jgi:hypothetical protein
MAWAGLDDALSHATRAIGLHPDPPAPMFIPLFLHHYRKGDDDLAVDAAQRGLSRLAMSPRSMVERVFLTGLVAAFGQLGQTEEATKLRNDYKWDFQIAKAILEWHNCCPELASRIEDGLRKAGIET